MTYLRTAIKIRSMFGKVFAAQLRSKSSLEVALKKSSITVNYEAEVALLELSVFRLPSHPHIIGFVSAYTVGTDVYIAMELAPVDLGNVI